MKAIDYQQQSKRTLPDALEVPLTEEQSLQVMTAMGLAGEAGEVCDLIKKGIFHRHGVDTDKLKEELGDVLFYVSAICTKFNLSMESVMQLNINKLKKRYPDGFNSKDSINRV